MGSILGTYRELTEDPVDLLTGSFSWEYQDFALYGRNDLSFIRYYESSDGEHNHALGTAGLTITVIPWKPACSMPK